MQDASLTERAASVPRKLEFFFDCSSPWTYLAFERMLTVADERAVNIAIGRPPVFPVNSAKAMRGAFVALEAGCLVNHARRVLQRYWGDLEDISQDAMLRPIVAACGMNESSFFASIASQPCKDKLRANADELIERGGFGSPTMFLGEHDMCFGNDRIALIEAQLSLAARN